MLATLPAPSLAPARAVLPTLFYGDNLRVLREHIPTACIDLVYLDPPFNSNRAYNVLFKDESGRDSTAQIQAFDDTWHWGREAAQTYEALVTEAPERVSALIGALHTAIGTNQMLAYLVMMTARLVELHRVLKPTGSLYLHCDPTASHYLRVVLDGIFGPENFRNEIIWRRTNAHNKLSKQYGPIHDTILFYTKSDSFVFHPGRKPYNKAYIKTNFPYCDDRGYYQSNVLTGAGVRQRDSGKPWRGYDPTPKGRHWAIPQKLVAELAQGRDGLSIQNVLDQLDALGLILHPSNPGSLPRYKQYLDQADGVLYQDIWAYQPGTSGLLQGTSQGIDEDVKWLDADSEKLGYPTQKPVGLLERILQTSSNPGDTILDPFCGCGTTIAAAQKLGRNWVGIDVTHLAIALQKYRLAQQFPGITVRVRGEPEDIGAARQLASDDRYQFQWWALSLIKARPLGGEAGAKEGKKGADRGIDGVIPFLDDHTGKPKRVLVQVKSGKVKSGDVRDLRGTIEREGAAIGVFVTLEEPSAEMRREAEGAGDYHSAGWNQSYPRLQLLTIAELLGEHPRRVEMPPTSIAFKDAPRVGPVAEQGRLL